MATADLKAFIETRLDVLSPGIDLSSGSPAQTQFVQPLIDYLGTDPFSTDILSFLQDRFLQEFPDIYPGDPGVINDTFVNPLIMFLEPFKRETILVQNDQSLGKPELLSDAGADALGANWFSYRSTGGFSQGVARVYFSNPISVTFQVTSRFFTSGGLSYFPTIPVGVTADQMVFNRQGSLFFVDVQVQAESSGSEYNIGVDEIAGVDGVFGYVKVTNLQAFSNGSARVSTPEFIGNIKAGLNERSLVTRRGATARILDVFRSTVRSVQEVGAQDEEMRRDILMAAGPGHAWMTGTVSLYGKVAYAQIKTVDDTSDTPTVSVGDTLYLYLDKYSYGLRWQALDQSGRFLRFNVEEVLAGPMQETTGGFQLSYVLRISGDVPVGLSLPSPVSLGGGLIRKSQIVVSSTSGADTATVESGGVHVFGRADIYVKPLVQTSSTTNFSYLTDDPARSLFKLQGLTLSTFGEGPGAHAEIPSQVNFVGGALSQDGAVVGDTLVIESGSDAGDYRILKIDDSDIVNGNSYAYLSRDLTKSDTDIRFSVVRSIAIDPFAARKLKIPFGGSVSNDLQTQIGSNAVRVTSPSSNVVELGAAVGDTLKILTGPDAGNYSITGFNADGKEFYVDRVLSSSNGQLEFEVYSRLGSIDLPLLRIKKIDILDTANQTIGVTIPPAEPVAVMPVADMTSAMVRGASQTGSGFVLPALTKADGTDRYITNTSMAIGYGDRRYSMLFDPVNGGSYLPMSFGFPDAAEFLFPLDAEKECSYFVATSEDNAASENFPPIDPKPGDALTLKSGPNKGSYLIKSVYKFKHKTGGVFYWSYFIKIHGTFPVDVFRSLIEFLDSVGITTSDIKIPTPTMVSYPTFFVNAYAALSTKIDAALVATGTASPGATAIGSIIAGMAEVEYEWGDPARGTIRTFVQEPTLFHMNTAKSSNPTLFDLQVGGGQSLTYRPDPNRYETYAIVPGKGASEVGPLGYPRDYSQVAGAVTLAPESGPNPLNAGVSVGDILEVYPEVLYHASGVTDRQTAVITAAGSSYITSPAGSGVTFTKDRVGDLLFIDEGKDKGGYVVQKFIDSKTLGLDRALLRTTPTIIVEGAISFWGYNGSSNLVTSTTPVFLPGHVGKYVTVYGVNTQYQGSYLIIARNSSSQIVVDASGRHLAPYAADTNGRWAIADAAVAPTNTTNGTELAGLQPIRVYSNVAVKQTITAVDPNPSVRLLTVSGSRTSGHKEPYSIYRTDVRRVTPAEIALNRDGPFYYFDTDVVSLGPSSSFNIHKDSYLTMRQGTYESLGYRHKVDDNTLTYSVRESGALDFSLKVLPVTATDSEDNMISLLGSPIQVTYEKASVVSDVQNFASSADDHVASADILVRHFLPSFVSYEAAYVGGSAASLIATDIIELIDALGIEATIDVSVIQKAIEDRGGNPETPTKLYVLVHDWDRKQWAEMSQNAINMSALVVPYNGTARVISFTAGPDVSGLTTLPFGEKINLQKL